MDMIGGPMPPLGMQLARRCAGAAGIRCHRGWAEGISTPVCNCCSYRTRRGIQPVSPAAAAAAAFCASALCLPLVRPGQSGG